MKQILPYMYLNVKSTIGYSSLKKNDLIKYILSRSHTRPLYILKNKNMKELRLIAKSLKRVVVNKQSITKRRIIIVPQRLGGG